jgi:hypothetical protein
VVEAIPSPTAVQASPVAQETPSSAETAPGDACVVHELPPSVVAMMVVAPTATQSFEEVHETLPNSETPFGAVCVVQVAPPSTVAWMSPPDTAEQVSADPQEIAPPPPFPPRVQVCPPSVEMMVPSPAATQCCEGVHDTVEKSSSRPSGNEGIDQSPVGPSHQTTLAELPIAVPTATQSPALAHETEFREADWFGSAMAVHDAPPFTVWTMPGKRSMVATQSSTVGHETEPSPCTGVSSGWFTQLLPPSVVPSTKPRPDPLPTA